MSRELATVRKVSAVQPLIDCEYIEYVVLDGWKSIVRKGDFKVGDLVIYCEIDSVLPPEMASKILKQGNRVKTAKIRGHLSQGLVLPLSALELYGTSPESILEEGNDLTSMLGITKYDEAFETENPTDNSFLPFPDFPRTHQKRCQNIAGILQGLREGKSLTVKDTRIPVPPEEHFFEITEKIDGSSMSCYLIKDKFGVCSHNVNLLDDTKSKQSFWEVAVREGIEEKMRTLGLDGYVLQGELAHPGLHSWFKGLLHQPTFFIFDIYNTHTMDYLVPSERANLVEQLQLRHVPVLETAGTLEADMDSLILKADGLSKLCHHSAGLLYMREGLVYKHISQPFSFKVISNQHLLGKPKVNKGKNKKSKV